MSNSSSEINKEYVGLALAVQNTLFMLIASLTQRRNIESKNVSTTYRDTVEYLKSLYDENDLLGIGVQPGLQLLKYPTLDNLLNAFCDPEKMAAIMQNWELHINELRKLKSRYGEPDYDYISDITPLIDKIIKSINEAESAPLDNMNLFVFTYDEFDLTLKMNGNTIYKFKRTTRIARLIEEGLSKSGIEQKTEQGDYKNLKKFKSSLNIDENIKNAFMWVTKNGYMLRSAITPVMLKNSTV